jgi:hypothetical protein
MAVWREAGTSALPAFAVGAVAGRRKRRLALGRSTFGVFRNPKGFPETAVTAISTSRLLQ